MKGQGTNDLWNELYSQGKHILQIWTATYVDYKVLTRENKSTQKF